MGKMGSTLARLRSEANLTQQELAERTSCSLRSIEDCEGGESPSLETLEEILEVLDVDLVDLGLMMGMTGRRPATREALKRAVEMSDSGLGNFEVKPDDDPEVDAIVAKVMRRLETMHEEGPSLSTEAPAEGRKDGT